MREAQKRDIARELRCGMSEAEHKLWAVIRRRQVSGCKFRRQCPIGPLVADFVCLERKLVVEVDGGQHWDSRTDQRRDAFLRSRGFRVLRFRNHDVLGNIAGVFQVIERALAVAGPHPNPPPHAGEGAKASAAPSEPSPTCTEASPTSAEASPTDTEAPPTSVEAPPTPVEALPMSMEALPTPTEAFPP